MSFTVNQGEIVGFLGPNGAGKSTTMNIITGYLSATEGSVRVDNYDILEKPLEVKGRLGYVPEAPPVYGEMTVREYLGFVCDIKKVRGRNRKAEIERVTELVKIADVRDRLVKNLSKGYQQRVGLAQGIVGNPPVLILDEPTIGLDPIQIIEIRNLIKELGKDHTVILSSHILPEVSAICSRLLIIHRGNLVASDTPANLSAQLSQTSRLQVRIAGPEEKVVRAIKSVEGVRNIEVLGTREPETVDFMVEAQKDRDVRRDLFHAMSKAGFPILQSRSLDITLEDIFIQLTQEEREVK